MDKYIDINCPKCNMKIRFKAESIGYQFKCRRCKTILTVSDPEENAGFIGGVIAGISTKIKEDREKLKQVELEKAVKKAKEMVILREKQRVFDEKKSSVIITTGGINREHMVLDIVFAVGMQKLSGGFLSGSKFFDDNKYEKMLTDVYIDALDQFKSKAVVIGADAVIHAKFDVEQIAMGSDIGKLLRVQVFCTGTAVKFL